MLDIRIAIAAKLRGIKYLVHFTSIENLPNIAKHGLMTRANLDEKSLAYNYNDDNRIDGLTNSISLTFTFPNYRMFWLYHKNSPSDYAMIFLDAFKILSELPCAFHATNASNNSERHRELSERMTLDAFYKMFYDENLRKKINLAFNEPTDPQAEVLCLADIPLKYFSQIAFEYEKLTKANKKLFPKVPCIVDKKFFSPRHDWVYWE